MGDGKFWAPSPGAHGVRAAGLPWRWTPLPCAACVFSDYVTTAAWARESLAFCYQENILDPSDLAIRPAEAIRRCEVAQMLFRMLDRAELLV